MITVIDCGAGNIGSIINTLTSLGMDFTVTADPVGIAEASALLLPGVGAAGAGMRNLKARRLDGIIRKRVADGVPTLGICLGMQLLFDRSQEDDASCLGILAGNVVRFNERQKVPQIGWNTVTANDENVRARRLFDGVSGRQCYFVNSYYPIPADPNIVAATTDYGMVFASAVATDNIFATQFHPEKSGRAGIQLLLNFRKEYL